MNASMLALAASSVELTALKPIGIRNLESPCKGQLHEPMELANETSLVICAAEGLLAM